MLSFLFFLNFRLKSESSSSEGQPGESRCKSDDFEYKITDATGSDETANTKTTISRKQKFILYWLKYRLRQKYIGRYFFHKP